MGAQMAGEQVAERRWYIVEAVYRMDVALEEALTRLDDVEPFRPLREVYRADRRARSRRPIHRKGEPRAVRYVSRFAPFLFVNCGLGDDLRREIEGLESFGGERLARGFLTLAGTRVAAHVPVELIDYYRTMPTAQPEPILPMVAVGEAVEFVDGPYERLAGEVSKILGAGRIVVDMSLFGRVTPVFCEAWQVRRLNGAEENGMARKRRGDARRFRQLAQQNPHHREMLERLASKADEEARRIDSAARGNGELASAMRGGLGILGESGGR